MIDRSVIAYAIALTALVCGPAQAQQATTTCGVEFGKWVCRTVPQRSGMDAYFDAQARAQQSADRSMSERQARIDAEAAQRDAHFRHSLQQQVSSMVSAGRCDDARRHALDNGDMDLAEQVMRVCSPQ